ncbi:MAG: recombinase family protein [Planctomycetota bacterium]|nr:recombinase family protein [Planctomycetaceae bacterium]MDQ3329260.1 recombinase family protein [Planctomycetota bacterium]
MKQYVARARVSSREQEREGFSLEVQEDALKRYAEQHNGVIVRLFKIAETASKRDERKTFKEMVAFAKKNSFALDGLLFYKVDRAARNLFDYVELERLESEYGVPFISISQQTENNPAGRMMRRTLANMASFFTEQMSVDISQGINRRVQEGWFPGKASYGYRNVRANGRRIVEVDPVAAANVRLIFQLYAYENQTLEGLVSRMAKEGAIYRSSTPKFNRTSVHNMLNDRAYIGEVRYREAWYPGKQEPLIDLPTWNRVQSLLGSGTNRSHTLTYAAELIQCAHCGHQITGELKTKQTKSGERSYLYYRCTKYSQPDHPRTRVTEAELDRQVLALFDKMRIEDEAIREWFRAVLASQTRDAQADSAAQRTELQRQATLLVQQQDRLLNLRIADNIDEQTFAHKQTELRDRLASIKLQLDVVDRSHDEMSELASKVFELSQTLHQKWLTADYSEKRRILEIIWLNCQLDGVTLVPVMRKPFDVIAEGLLLKESGADGI